MATSFPHRCGPEKGRFARGALRRETAVASLRSTAEAVQSSALSLQRVDDVHRRDGLALGVLRVGDRVADYVLQEDLQDASRLFVDQPGDPFHSPSTGQTTDSGLGDALDVIPQYLTMALGASLAESLTALASARHDDDERVLL